MAENPPDPGRRVLILYNPTSGRGAGREAMTALTRALDARHIPHEVVATEGPGHGARAAGARSVEDCRAVVVIGGDGTLLDVMNGPVAPGLPVGLLPLGTANVLACSLGLSRDPERLAEAIRGGRVRRLDLLECNGHRFVSVAGVGFDAYVVAALDRERQGTLASKASYSGPIVRALGRYRFPALRVRVDGRTVGRPAGFVIVGNVWNYGGLLRLAPRARPDDGLMDVCIFHGRGRASLLRYLSAAPFGMHLAFSDVRYLRCKDLVVDGPSGEDVPVQLDGDPGGSAPARFRVLPGAATLLTT